MCNGIIGNVKEVRKQSRKTEAKALTDREVSAVNSLSVCFHIHQPSTPYYLCFLFWFHFAFKRRI